MPHVVDASVVVQACLSEAGFEPLAGFELVAPRLLWSEVTCVLRELAWRAEVPIEVAAHDLPDGPCSAFELAHRLGWTRTYDAEYVALAVALDGVLITSDGRFRRAVSDVVRVIGPTGV